MSRCFPYPPPGYARKCASNEALIWTIKLQRESEKPKSEKKKDKRKEKKEKKRGTISSEKKEKKRDDKSNGTIPNCQKLLTDDVKQIGKYPDGKQQETSYEHKQSGKYPEVKQQELSYERMEKSSITEEHGMPCSSSDSTENSRKRKRQSPAPSGNNGQRNPGTVIRIVLNSRKKEDHPTLSNNVVPILKRVDNVPQKADLGVKSSALNLHITPPKSNSGSLSQNANAVVKSLAPKLHDAPPKINPTQDVLNSSNMDKPSPLSIPTRVSAMEVKTASTSKGESKLPRPLRKYKALFENWVPSSMEIDTVTDDDEDWLFGSSKDHQADKRMKCCKEEVSSYASTLQQPRAQFISDADIYALPFTVPF